MLWAVGNQNLFCHVLLAGSDSEKSENATTANKNELHSEIMINTQLDQPDLETFLIIRIEGTSKRPLRDLAFKFNSQNPESESVCRIFLALIRYSCKGQNVV